MTPKQQNKLMREDHNAELQIGPPPSTVLATCTRIPLYYSLARIEYVRTLYSS